ncbi:MAG: hypothetical protein WC889_06070 [Myxococcota bacterium]|jgi:acetyltransferase-like isoleucine patch superfamily enzyme
MKAYILPSNVVISPFNEAVAETLVVFERLCDIQDAVLRDRGLEPVRVASAAEITDGEYFLTYDNVYVTRRAFRDFYKKALKSGRSAQMALPDCGFIKRYSALQDIQAKKDASGNTAHCFNIWYVKTETDVGARHALPVGAESAVPLVIKLKEISWQQNVPPNMFKKRTLDIPITTSVAFHITHWVPLLWANQVGILVRWVEQITGHPLWTAWKLLKALIFYVASGLVQLGRLESVTSALGWPAIKLALFRSFNKVGKNCEIHPDAIIQFCIIGDNVKVGPQCYLFGSILDDGVIMEEKTKVTLTSLGHGCYVSQLTVLNGVAAYPDGDVCIDGMQFCMSGRNVKLTGLARPLDIRTDGPIKVMFNGKAVAIGQEILGSCFGHGCFIGPDVYIASGREIPSGAVIIQPPGHILFKIPPDIEPGVPMVIDKGTLKKFNM